MCTLSIFKRSDGFRVFMNRDERHDRPPELPPQTITPKNTVIGPVDPLSGGTWIAYNENGYWGCLLNGYFETPDNQKNQDNVVALKSESQTQTTPPISRGGILPMLLATDDPLHAAKHLDTQYYVSFRLVIGSPTHCALYEWNGTTYAPAPFHAQHHDDAFFLSSSSWNQDAVITARKAIFETWLQEHPCASDDLDGDIPAFHYSQSPAPQSAPMMMRSYSGTKSITTLDVTHDHTRMTYHKIDNQMVALSRPEKNPEKNPEQKQEREHG